MLHHFPAPNFHFESYCTSAHLESSAKVTANGETLPFQVKNFPNCCFNACFPV